MRAIACVLLLLAAPALADSSMPDARLANVQLVDPAQEAKAHALMLTIRCVVCQGQSIADSDADMAGDMRALIRDRIRRGEEPEAIRQWMIDRYGEWISYYPRFGGFGLALWLLPIMFFGGGLFLLKGRFKRKMP